VRLWDAILHDTEMDEPTDHSDDQRFVEISSLEAIFPEIQKPDPKNPFAFRLEIPVNPTSAVTVAFPAASTIAPNVEASASQPMPSVLDSHKLSHLPSLVLDVSLPDRYPTDQPPVASVSATLPWLPANIVKGLEADSARLWEELGRDLVVFTYIDHIQQAADDCFGMISSSGTLEVDLEHKLAILDYDIKAKRAAFEKGSFECGVCLGS
jgi:E3 ubiquitin-protein ligase RNF14